MGTYMLMSQNEKRTGGVRRKSNLANAFEAVIGAIYLDQGYAAAEKFIQDNLIDNLAKIIDDKTYIDAKTNFQEKAQEIFGEVETEDAYMYEGKEGVKVFLGPANEAGRKEDRIDILPHSLHVWYEFTDKVTEFCDWLLENVYLMKDMQMDKN